VTSAMPLYGKVSFPAQGYSGWVIRCVGIILVIGAAISLAPLTAILFALFVGFRVAQSLLFPRRWRSIQDLRDALRDPSYFPNHPLKDEYFTTSDVSDRQFNH